MSELDTQKAIILEQCRLVSRDKILKQYPIHTQINILLGIEGDLNEFKAFITEKKNEYQELKDAINGLEDIEDLKKFNSGDDVSDIVEEASSDFQKAVLSSAVDSVKHRFKKKA